MATSQHTLDQPLYDINSKKVQERINERIASIQKSLRLSDSYKNDLETICINISNHRRNIQSWSPRFDFDLLDKTKLNFEQLWPDIFDSICLAIECGMYEQVKKVFLDVRHLLQWTGRLEERIYIATWLMHEAEKRRDASAMYLAISSLVWSYTSSGAHQDLDKSVELWKRLLPFLSAIENPEEYNRYRAELLAKIGKLQYTELIMDIYEGGVRLAVRCRQFSEAKDYTKKARDEISVLSQNIGLSKRLKERFDLCFLYHEGVSYYLREKFKKSKSVFEEIVERAEIIGWTRAIRGAKSWLGTLAIESNNYDACESILRDIFSDKLVQPDKRDGICRLLKAQMLRDRNCYRAADNLGQEEAIHALEEANHALERFTKPQKKNESESIDKLTFMFRLTPSLV